MGLRSYALIIGFVCAFCLNCGVADTRGVEKSDKSSYMASIMGGFRTSPELSKINDLLEKKNLKAAYENATEIIEKESSSFLSAKMENYLKGQVYFLRGEISAELGHSEAALEDMKGATEFGHPFAPYQVASRLVIQSSLTQDPLERKQYLEKAHAYHLMGAELGHSICIDHIQVALRAKQRKEDEHYWFLLERIGESPEQISKFQTFYTQVFNEDDRAFFAEVMEMMSLSNGQKLSAIQGLPGRSTLVSAYVDLIMRKGLRFVWKAFFQEDKGDVTFTLQEVFENYRNIIRKNPLADLWLLINNKYDSGNKALSLNTDKLIDNTLPGDQIVVRCGRLSHYSTVWSIDKSKNEVYLLDPFDEFWQPSHNRCVTAYEHQPYKYKRYLTRVSYSELQEILVAVFSIRDRLPRISKKIEKE